MLLRASNEEIYSFCKWYPQFQDISIESLTIPISANIRDYLLEDSTLVLPQEVYVNETKSSFADQEGESLNENEEDSDHSEIEQPSFPAFSDALKNAISSLGGEVFIKLNWSAPVDAAWITSNKTLKCTSIEDIYLLLKSSDVLANELASIKNNQESSGISGCVVIKKWHDIFPGHEFRCFVAKQKLIAISPRDYKTYYGYIAQNQFSIIEDIEKFFKEKIEGKFQSDNYTFDIIRESSSRIKILDFGPLDLKKTKSLFTWQDLQELESKIDADGVCEPEFRFLGEDPGFQPNPYQYYGLPHDLGNLLDRRSSSSLINQIMEEVDTQRT